MQRKRKTQKLETMLTKSPLSGMKSPLSGRPCELKTASKLDLSDTICNC